MEKYFLLYKGNIKEIIGSVLRVKEGSLEELTGFYIPKKTKETSKKIHYKADINTDSYGNKSEKRGKHSPDIVEFSVNKEQGTLTINKPSKKGEMHLTEISKSQATKKINKIENMRNLEQYVFF